MNAERLLQHFNRLSEAPDAIPRLRQFVLELAVRGKLVPQDPYDEPAAIFEARAESRSAKTVRDTEIEDIWPYVVPHAWAWRRIMHVSDQVTDGEHATPQRITERQIPLVTAKNVRDGEMDYTQMDWVSLDTAEKAWRRCRPSVGDILLVCVGATTGRLCILREVKDMVLVRSVALIRPSQEVDVNYLAVALRSPICQEEIWKQIKATAQPCLYINRINSLPIPLPPLTEQHRIVAKVDELMALCDQLELAKSEREQSRDRLVAASLHRLNSLADTEEANTPDAFRDHALFTFNHLSRLTARPEHIKQLRETILNLAVRGQLVPQDPNEDCVREGLKVAFETRRNLVKRAELPRKCLTESAWLAERPFSAPKQWEFVYFDHLASPRANALKAGPFGSALKKDSYVAYGYKIYGQEQVIKQNAFFGDYYISEKKFNQLKACEVSPGDLLISLVGTIGKVLILPSNIEPGIINPRLIKMSLNYDLVEPEYIRALLAAPWVREFLFAESHGTTMDVLNLTILRSLPIPLPPLGEQHRIVTKVDELMALCDQLEDQLTITDADSRRLLEAVLYEALAPAPEEIA
jgi:type I restriction enzyme S subunit